MSSSDYWNHYPSNTVGLAGRKGVRVDPEILQFGAVFFDAIYIIVIGLIADHVVLGLGHVFDQCTVIAIMSSIIFVSTIVLCRGYSVESLVSPQIQLRLISFAWLGILFIVAWFAFLLRIGDGLSRLGVVFFFAAASSGVALAHVGYAAFLSWQLKSGNLHMQRVFAVVVGDLSEFDHIKKNMDGLGIDFLGCHIISRNTRTLGSDCSELEDRIRTTLSAQRCDAVVVFAPWENRRRIEEIFETLRQFPTPAILMADRTANRIVKQTKLSFGALNGFELQRAPLSKGDRIIKRAFDIAVALVAICVLSPLLSLTALAVVIESGRPVLFRQTRKGFGGRTFEIVKFRSMTVTENGHDVVQARRNDRRVTPLGRILRRTSIDELPQLFNVLKGDMSIVGPRPHAILHDNQYDEQIATYAYRHHVKPGITGWAQIKGYRGETRELRDMEARVKHDIWYINHWSIWLDVRIVLQTAVSVLADKNAY